jgi:hypothetical protein
MTEITNPATDIVYCSRCNDIMSPRGVNGGYFCETCRSVFNFVYKTLPNGTTCWIQAYTSIGVQTELRRFL